MARKDDRAGLERIKRTYEKYGSEDPFHAVLTHEQFRGGAAREAFFASGEKEIAELLAWLDDLGLELGRGHALDFGCGVGRLSQALANHFDRVTGVDIASSMVETARAENRRGDRVAYRVNDRPDLEQFPDGSFDLVYSNITLQHSPPEATVRYVAEFVRVLGPGGVGVFQVPNGPDVEPRSLGEAWYRLRRVHLRRLWKRLRGKPLVEMHRVARARIERVLGEAGGSMVSAVDVGRRPGRNYKYCFVKPQATDDPAS